ncbi:MAG: CusA/CzcA family heavy metal efflux RND transporter [Phycisphaeraceae bacterium]
MLEKILRFSINNRFLVVLLTLAAAGVGVWSLTRLPIDAVPDITNNQVQINTEYEALGPEQIEKQVTFPIETALAGIEGLDYTRSISRNGFSQVTVVFDEGVDTYWARSQVLERLSAVGGELPPGADPQMGPISTGLGEVFMYAVEYQHPGGEGLDPAQIKDGEPGWQSDGSYLTPEGERLRTRVEKAAYLRTLQEYTLAPQLRQVEDVAGVDAIGGYKKQYTVMPDPMRLVSYGLTFNDLIEALEANNTAVGAKYIQDRGEAYQVRASGLLQTLDDIRRIVIGHSGGTPVYVEDVAEVEIGREIRYGSASINGEEAVVGTALMIIGGNSRTVAYDVGQRLEEINATLPADIVARPLLDRTSLVDQTIHTVQENLTLGAIFVIVVLFLLLGNVRAALITALAIPLSMLLTATGMVASETSANLLSLGAIDFGIIVDGSVIIVENCVRRLAERQHELGRKLTLSERLETVFAASKEVRTATAFGEAIIITVYLPILFLTGVEGKMFQPMALTVIFALAGAFVLSLTFIPAMVAIFMRGKVKEKEVLLIRWAKAGYEPLVGWAVKARWAVVAVAVVAFGGSLWLFTTLGQEFVPQLDEGNIAMHAMRIPSTALETSQENQFILEEKLAAIPEVEYVFSKTGTAEVAADPMPPNVSDNFIILEDEAQWRSMAALTAAAEEVEAALPTEAGEAHDDHDEEEGDAHDDHGHGEPQVAPDSPKAALLRLIRAVSATVPGNNYELTQPIEMRFNELISGVRADVAVKVFGDEFDVMLPAAEAIAGVLHDVPGASDVTVEQVEGLPILDVQIDRVAISRLGLNVRDVQDLVAAAVGGREAGLIFQGDRRFDLIVRLPDAMRDDVTALAQLPVPLPSGVDAASRFASLSEFAPSAAPFVPLGEIATLQFKDGLNQVSRENGKRRVVVTANVRGRDIGSFVAEARQQIADLAPPPPGTYLDWGGQFENLESARRRLMIVVPVCFFLIFILLFSTFNSVKYAVMVFLCVPLALTGGIVALWLRDMPFSISAAVGFIALSGVAVLNGLVMVTFINQLREQGVGLEEAIRRGAVVRLRPVLMTATVASLGFVPMALSTGAGAEVQKPLATVVIGGIISATLLTLVVLPAVYRIWHLREPQAEPVPAETRSAVTASP